jgi:mannose-6-phosphate isomerase-like protein (cupin superfamily)
VDIRERGARVSERGLALMSIEHHDAKVSVHYRHQDVDVMVIEIGGRGRLNESTLTGVSSWHLVLEGEAHFQVNGHDWDVLPDHAIRIDDPSSYVIVNPLPRRLRLLSVVVGGSARRTPEEVA